MPFADESFHLVYCSAAFKNFSEPVQAINEMYRVLRPGGQAIIEDLRKDVSVEQLDAYIRQSGRSRFDAWLTKWTFRLMLINRAYTRDQFNQMASQSCVHGCELALDAIGFEARFIKPGPAMAAA